jgi:hypothetical protein
MPAFFLFLNCAAEVYRRCDMPSRALDCLKRCHAAFKTDANYNEYDLYARSKQFPTNDTRFIFLH